MALLKANPSVAFFAFLGFETVHERNEIEIYTFVYIYLARGLRIFHVPTMGMRGSDSVFLFEDTNKA